MLRVKEGRRKRGSDFRQAGRRGEGRNSRLAPRRRRAPPTAFGNPKVPGACAGTEGAAAYTNHATEQITHSTKFTQPRVKGEGGAKGSRGQVKRAKREQRSRPDEVKDEWGGKRTRLRGVLHP